MNRLLIILCVMFCMTTSLSVNAQGLKIEKEVTEFVCTNSTTISENLSNLAVVRIENTSRTGSLGVIINSQDGNKTTTIGKNGTEEIFFSRYQQGKVTVTLWYSNGSCAKVNLTFLTKK